MTLDRHAQRVLDHLDVDELVKVALDLGNIDSPTGSEGPVGEIATLVTGAQLYALTALQLCNQDRSS
jgi:hypothetical protein